MADTDPDIDLPNLDPTKVGDEIAKKEGKKPISEKSLQDKNKKEEKLILEEKNKKAKEDEDSKKIKQEKENKELNTFQSIDEYANKTAEEINVNNDNVENKENRFSEYKAIVAFSEAISSSKKDPAGLSILKWVRQYIKHLNKFSDTTRAIIYSNLDRESFVDKSRSDYSFPQFPNDISPEDQSRLCISAFARKYVTTDNVSIADQDLLSLDLSYEFLKQKRKLKKEEKESSTDEREKYEKSNYKSSFEDHIETIE